jgi:hypothetical protein
MRSELEVSRNRLSPEGRALLKCELEYTLAAIGEEVERLKPLLLASEPDKAVDARYRALARSWQDAREVLNAMADAEVATQH